MFLCCLRFHEFKGGQMGHYEMASLWFAFFFRMNNCLAQLMLHKEKEFPNDSGRPLGYNNFIDKKQNDCC